MATGPSSDAAKPELNLILFAHYLQALEFQRKACQIVGVLEGKRRTFRISRSAA